jgi:hypothetical protein
MAATAAPSQHALSFAHAFLGFIGSTTIMAAVMVLMAAL